MFVKRITRSISLIYLYVLAGSLPVALQFISCRSGDNNNKKSSADSLVQKKLTAEQIELKKKAVLLNLYFKQKEKAGFNGNVLIAKNGKKIFSKSFGYADIQKKTPLDSTVLFQLASTSKPFTAVAIMILQHRGELAYGDDIQKFIPDFPYKNISIKDLLTQRSGLSNYMYFTDSLYKQQDIELSNDELVSIITKHKPSLYAPPNKKFEYCNTNYALLATIIEKISGMSYAEFLHKELFDKIGMKNTFIKGDAELSKRTVAVGHHANKKKYDCDYLDGTLGDKNIYSTTDDMLLWDQALSSDTLLPQSVLSEAFRGYSNEHPGKRNYGYGFRVITNGKDSTKVIYHNGWWHGFNNVFYRRMADRTTIIILSNKRSAGIFYSSYDILNILDGTTFSSKNREAEGAE